MLVLSDAQSMDEGSGDLEEDSESIISCENDNCDHNCQMVDGKPRCFCNEGFRLDDDDFASCHGKINMRISVNLKSGKNIQYNF